MKPLPAFLALALAGTACQPQASAPQVLAAGLPKAALDKTAAPPADSLTASQRRLLQQHSLADLLETNPTHNPKVRSFDGFFGADHRHIEVIFTEVRQDASQPNRYYLQGKNRYKGQITPFTGTLLLTRLADQPRFTDQEVAKGFTTSEHNQAAMFTALGNFVLRQDSTAKNAGVFRGRVAIDWWVNPQGEVREESRTRETLTQDGGIKFEGRWTPYGPAAPQPVVWVADIFSYGPRVLQDFGVGERTPNFKSKYARLGWDDYWKNDEWWADTPKPTATL